MSFTRTISGLNNQHRFYNVDFIVFLEGGNESYNKEQVYQGRFSTETEDIIFWQRIFEVFRPNRKLKFKSIGSKQTLKAISEDILQGNLTKIILTMDNEFDEVLNQRIDHPQIYYTYGYSWENDIWNSEIIVEVIREITAINITSDEIEYNFSQFLKNIDLAVKADGHLFSINSSFFPKKGHLFCVNCMPTDLPTILEESIEKRFVDLQLNKMEITNFGTANSITPLKYCYGHLLADYCCQVVIHYIKKRHKLTSISRDIIYRMGINKFFINHFTNSISFQHYEYQFSQKIA
ncbi:DUF4435 domain-containing protein [Pedobacter sp. GR22-10]|uniref:DUF4435 domain-containing protein n=1 Tax=Pedobacter sp. GR22-10 TaxID=2994472 RepID=UPI002245C2BA|nr:DUF4435 domain-containing protein [Pedobacter sp. GR22-10]MCX2431116.1 DUF4435 domain-containing protein [Pedobacter sp. GR22-10]